MQKLKVGIIGAGNIAGVMATTLKGMDSAYLYAVAARDKERAEDFADKFGAEKAYGSYEELLQDEAVELVYVSTPHSHHFEHAKLCIDYGKPVLCEKAFCANAKQAEELLAYAKEKGVFITEAIWTRYMPFLKTIREVIASGVIGEPRSLTANLGYPLAHIPRMQEPYLAGGALLDLGVYALHFAAMMFGEDVRRLSAACTYTEKGMDEQDSITLIFADGKMAVLNCTMLAAGDRKGIIHGTKGYAVIENINNFESMSVYDSSHKQLAFYERPKQITGYEYEVEASAEAIRNGWLEHPAITHEETLHIMRQMDEVRKICGVKYPFD